MKATIERANLLRSLGHVQSVVERRNTIPILSNVLIEASADGTIRLAATDLDLQINEALEAVSVEVAGATTVSAHTLFDIVRKLPEGTQVSDRRGWQDAGCCRALALQPQHLAAGRFSDHCRGRSADPV
jgi:DNA polymerase-3 subunit beta